MDVNGVPEGSIEVHKGSRKFLPSQLSQDPLHGMSGPMTRSMTRKMQQALNQLIEEVQGQESLKISDVDLDVVHVLSIV